MQDRNRLNIQNELLKKARKDEQGIRNELERLFDRIQRSFKSVRNIKNIIGKKQE